MRRLGILVLAVAALVSSFALGGSPVPGKTPSGTAPGATVGATGPRFTIANSDLHSPLDIIAYGDTRFTDPSNTTATSPQARRALVAKIAEEHPDALLINGDVPWHGGAKEDYVEFRNETRAWRDEHLRVFPILGNHEFAQCGEPECLANWWQTFPELNGARWYSVAVGRSVYAIALDSDDSLLPGSAQTRWLEAQIASLPRSVKFVLIGLHHPPVADAQMKLFSDHNPRPNEIAVANLLKEKAPNCGAKFIVIAGHIHNYERFEQDGITYLVSGGGGAMPYPVERSREDKYQGHSFPNYHYIKLVLSGNTLKATMYRLSDPERGTFEAKDSFEVDAK